MDGAGVGGALLIRRRGTAAQSMLALQRTIGNRAVKRLLARYDTGEHAQFGTDRVVFRRGDVAITENEMITMGDLYERIEDMYEADLDELRTLVTLVRRDRDYYTGVGPVRGVSNDEWERATPKGPHRTKTFLDLAKDNATHYGPRAGGSDGRDHKSEWERIHRQALDRAHAGDLEQGLAYNAFAAHFLTDAFAAGHLVAKADVVDRSRSNWDRQVTEGRIFKNTNFTREVAKRVLKDPRSAKLMGYRVKFVDYVDMSDEQLSDFLWQFAKREPGEFFDAFLKLVHDELNKTGVEVDNDHGDGPWLLPGDGSLASSPKTLEIGQDAVAAAARNLIEASKTRDPIDYTRMFNRVWSYTPQPTASGRAHIDDVLAKLLDPNRKESVAAFADFLSDHIDAVIAQLHDRGYLATPKELAERAADTDRESVWMPDW